MNCPCICAYRSACLYGAWWTDCPLYRGKMVEAVCILVALWMWARKEMKDG